MFLRVPSEDSVYANVDSLKSESSFHSHPIESFRDCLRRSISDFILLFRLCCFSGSAGASRL